MCVCVCAWCFFPPDPHALLATSSESHNNNIFIHVFHELTGNGLKRMPPVKLTSYVENLYFGVVIMLLCRSYEGLRSAAKCSNDIVQ